jgi:hypothetical protein
MKPNKRVAPVAAAAIVHGLCPAEKGGHEHIPNEIAVDPSHLAGKTVVMGFTTAVDCR